MAQFRKDTHTYLPQETTIFEVVMLADQYGNLVGPANPSGVAVDGFGRSRISQPITLFDSFHRYRENDKWNTANSASGSAYTYDVNSACISMNVSTSSGNYVYRETSKVFAYQPGKSLHFLQTFVFAPGQTGLRQRNGYFGSDNGIYLELDGNTLSFVIRSKSSGVILEERIPQSQWNIDKLDGTGSSLLTLDITKAHIFWGDIEWLGVGTVRCGFVINGQLIHCHSFHHSNLITSTYMTTACLPLRFEIENTSAVANSSTMKAICSSVISEGGYELRGDQYSIGHLPNTSYTLATAGTFYPVVALRIRGDRPDSIVLPKNICVLGLTGNGSKISYKLVSGANVVGGTWVNADSANSAVQYNLTGTSMTGGRSYVTAYQAVNNQGSVAQGILGNDIFRHQLERNTFNGTNTTIVLAVAGAGINDTVLGSMDWEEIS